MDQHPIKSFIDKLFPNEQEDKRVVWANKFIDEEYDDIDELKKMRNKAWWAVTKDLPIEVV